MNINTLVVVRPSNGTKLGIYFGLNDSLLLFNSFCFSNKSLDKYVF
jgi:hypothetical protein